MRIKVVAVGPVQKEAKYFQFVLTYVDLKQSKEYTRKMMSFTKVPYEALKGAKEGEVYEVEIKKNDNGFWEWTEVSKIVEGEEKIPVTSGTKSGTWETPEERARRQILIVRQSCLAQAVALANTKFGVDMEDVLEQATQFEEWVNRE